MTQVSSQVTALVQPQKVGQVEVASGNVFDTAFAIYSPIDFRGTGNAVIRLKNIGASPQERDFTGAELTDGTYTSWYNSGITYVTKMYDQMGVAAHVVSAVASFQQPQYLSATNEVYFAQAGYYGYNVLHGSSSSAITAAFEDNIISSHTTLVMSGRKIDNTLGGLPNSMNTLMAMRDGYSPVAAIGAKHRALRIKPETYSDDVGLSAKGNNNVAVTDFGDGEIPLGTALKSYFGGFYRRANASVTLTDYDLHQNLSHEIDTNKTTLDDELDIARFELGNNKFVTQGMIFFNKSANTFIPV